MTAIRISPDSADGEPTAKDIITYLDNNVK